MYRHRVWPRHRDPGGGGPTIAPVGQISLNFARLADPQIDEALDLGRASPDTDVRKRAYGLVETWVER